ncbi:MAG TPA: hypothetical protein VNS09_19165 [Solirubrobacter sp.]|nr:hypothetical protein [Solirubrobacter sp.]
MPPTPLLSRTISTAMLAGALFVAEAATELAHRQAERFVSVGDYLVEIFFGLALAAASVALFSLRVAGGRVRIGAGVAAAGQAALAVCSVATIIHGSDALGPLFVLGLLASLAGFAIIATSARAVGLVLGLGFVASMAVPHGGAAIIGLAWLTVSVLLRGPAGVGGRRGTARRAAPRARLDGMGPQRADG